MLSYKSFYPPKNTFEETYKSDSKKLERQVRAFPNLFREFKRYKVAEITFLILTIISIIRSLIHIFTPDGGAGSIAGIDLSVEGGDTIVSIFALWGISQLLMAIVFLIVFFRYKNLIPLMYILIIAEYTMRIAVGMIKPIEVTGVPPGAVGNFVIIPLAIIMLIFSILQPKKRVKKT